MAVAGMEGDGELMPIGVLTHAFIVESYPGQTLENKPFIQNQQK